MNVNADRAATPRFLLGRPLVGPGTALPLSLCLTLCLGGGCSILGRTDSGPASLIPTRHLKIAGPFRIATNAPLGDDDPETLALRSLGRSIENALGVRIAAERDPIDIFILDDKESFRHFLLFHHPDCPPRRAFFVSKGSKREVYAYRQDRLAEDLRHEGTHALLHATFGDLPLWLDEGLAEYFEVPDSRLGLNAEHISRLPSDVADGWAPDLKRLEALDDAREMTPRDYRESWAWVHSLLDSPARKLVLLAYLQDLQGSKHVKRMIPLSERLTRLTPDELPEAVLLSHIRRVSLIRAEPPSTADSRITRVPSLRLQNPSAESSFPKTRRGFFGRLFSRLLDDADRADR